MAWSEPKNDWAVADLVPETELNILGDDLIYLKDTLEDTTADHEILIWMGL